MDCSLIHDLNPTLYEKSRLSIVTTLLEHESLSFIELKNLLSMTDGNLCVHLKTLERKGYLLLNKKRQSGKMRTSCRLTDEGKQAIERHLGDLERLLSEVRRFNQQT